MYCDCYEPGELEATREPERCPPTLIPRHIYRPPTPHAIGQYHLRSADDDNRFLTA